MTTGEKNPRNNKVSVGLLRHSSLTPDLLTLFMLWIIFLLGFSLLLLLYLMKLDLPCLMAGCSVSASAPLSSVSVVRTGPS